MLEQIHDKQEWKAFLQCREDNGFVNPTEMEELACFVEEERYLPIAQQIQAGTYEFSIPQKKMIAKNASGKKRVVYSFTRDEMWVLKLIAHKLYVYDGLFSPNLYSFRQGKGVKSAIGSLRHIANVRKMYGLKIDISNYFNSIVPERLLEQLRTDVDADVHRLLEPLLMRKEVRVGNSIIQEETGAMAGVPISPFLANYYLKDMDAYFWNEPVVYMRYADDILLFANTEVQLEGYTCYMLDFLASRGLNVNEEKRSYIRPGEEFDFLGFRFGNHEIDVSAHAVEKMKAKIRRKARALRRWYMRKGATPENALKAMNKRFNSKFYGTDTKEMSWMYWYFPYITTSASLHVIDSYMQQMQRWIITGRHSKINFKACTYDKMKQYGYRPLVSEYYAFKAQSGSSEEEQSEALHQRVVPKNK